MAATLDLAEFRLLRAAKSGGGAAFTQLWNAQAGAAWSVFRAMVERDDDAVGWMASFRLELAERAAAFRVEEGLGPQVGRALWEHARPSFAAAGPLPEGPLTSDEAGLRRLPAATRLAYLVDLFFDWTPPDPTVRQAYRLLEPAEDTDARLLIHAALLRNPPAEALILPPGVRPPASARRTVRRRSAWVVGLLLGLILGAAWWLQPPDPARLHQAALSASGGVLVEAAPDALADRLEAAGVAPDLAEVPDLSRRGLELVGGRVAGGVVVLLYQGRGCEWTLQHREGAIVAGQRQLGGEYVGGGDDVSWVGWRDAAGSWVLAARAPPAVVLGTARDLIADRELAP